VDLHGGERCIATGIHLSVAIQADVTGSKGTRGAWQHGGGGHGGWGGAVNKSAFIRR
jgi:hypothetical protein